MECILYDGDYSTKAPAILKIKVVNAITTNDLIVFYIAPFKNPSASLGSSLEGNLSRKLTVVLKVMT